MKNRLISLLTAVLLLCSVLSVAATANAANSEVYNYYKQKGSHGASTLDFGVSSNSYRYRLWYPKDIAKLGKCPALLYSNPTGFSYEDSPSMFEFIPYVVSRGYIVVASTDKRCGDGKTMDAAMSKLVAMNKSKTHKLYNKVDLTRIVLAGHSQGGLSMVNMADKSKFANAKYYKAMYGASSMCDKSNSGPFAVACNFKSVSIPALMTAGTSGIMESSTCPLEGLRQFKNDMKSDVYIARKTGVDHSNSMAQGYPYMIAWFEYQLKGDAFAAKAFTGVNPELKANSDWQDFDYKKPQKGMTLKKVDAFSKSFKAFWVMQYSATGYQLQYATDSKFKTVTTVRMPKPIYGSKTVKSLKAKKLYYVRIRAYTKVGTKIHYSKWSKTIKVTTKA